MTEKKEEEDEPCLHVRIIGLSAVLLVILVELIVFILGYIAEKVT